MTGVIVGMDGIFKDGYSTPRTMVILNNFISIVLFNLEINKCRNLSFDYIVSICLLVYRQIITDVIIKDNRYSENSKKLCLDYYNRRFNITIEAFDIFKYGITYELKDATDIYDEIIKQIF